VRYYGAKAERTAWRYLTRSIFTLDDGKMFLSLALRSYHETVEEILELTKKVQPAGGRQYQSVATCSEVDVNGHVIIIY